MASPSDANSLFLMRMSVLTSVRVDPNDAMVPGNGAGTARHSAQSITLRGKLMRGFAQLLVGIIGICVFFWALGFWWGVGILLLFALMSFANGGDRGAD